MSKRGGAQPGAGRPKGTKNKISGVTILDAVQQECGKPFEQLLAEGYHMTILAGDMPARQNYEKMILSKVVADKHEIDHTTLGQSLHAAFNFPPKELPDWSVDSIETIEPATVNAIPVTITLDAKSD